ncbi:HAAS signaling domain-containing protein [Candidatus Izimaplasma bacterium ZiA1]|uniref:HAAS signaling domain-containing protein n=1 Tax=Candidatus Izimoplasma sp. ZiA1 TaxID=2024899 RepID=UPI0014398DE6
MKNKYLTDLKENLDLYDMDNEEKKEILDDYSSLIDDALNRGMSNEEVVSYLGKPNRIIRELTEGCKRVKKSSKDDKIIAISPFITLITYLILGFGFDLWHPGWVVFILIPITAIIVEMGKNHDEHLTTALSPFVSGMVYLYIGVYHNLWHPGWLVLLVIPVLAIFNSRRTMKFIELLTALSPFAALITYIVIGEQGYYHPGWLVFFIVPIVGALNEKKISKLLLTEVFLVVGVVGYLYIYYTFDETWIALIAFIPSFAYGLYSGHIQIEFGNDRKMNIVVIATIVLFLLVGILTTVWSLAWLILLVIPVYSIIRFSSKDTHLIAISPFFSLTIFMILGVAFGLWAYSWMAFLLIPMVAIIKEA